MPATPASTAPAPIPTTPAAPAPTPIPTTPATSTPAPAPTPNYKCIFLKITTGKTQKTGQCRRICNASLHDLEWGLYKRVWVCSNDGGKNAAIHFATKKIAERFVENSLGISWRGRFPSEISTKFRNSNGLFVWQSGKTFCHKPTFC